MAGQPGDGGGIGALSAHVSHHDCPRAVADVEGVEEVTTDLVALAGGKVPGCQLDARDLGQRVGEQARLECAGHIGALGEESGVVGGHGGAPRQLLGDGEIVGAEAAVG